MLKQYTDEKTLLTIPVRVVVHSLEDGLPVSHLDTTVSDVLPDEFVEVLKYEIQGDKRELHELQKFRLEAIVRRELLPKEASGSPIHLPYTWVEVVIEGDISTWKKQPYHSTNLN